MSVPAAPLFPNLQKGYARLWWVGGGYFDVSDSEGRFIAASLRDDNPRYPAPRTHTIFGGYAKARYEIVLSRITMVEFFFEEKAP